jgi:hypothetical protein
LTDARLLGVAQRWPPCLYFLFNPTLVSHHGAPLDRNSHSEETGFLRKQDASAAVRFGIDGTLHHPPVDASWFSGAIENPFIARRAARTVVSTSSILS